MKALLYKEFKLGVNPLFYLTALLSFLMLIPQWPYFIALMYFFFITVPNMMGVAKANEDVRFSVMLPVRKCDIVGARLFSIVALQLTQIFVAVIAAFINRGIYSSNNTLFDLNLAFFGFAFAMYGLFNVIFLPMFYKTAYKFGAACVASIAAAFVFVAGAEFLVILVPGAKFLDSTVNMTPQIPVLLGGIVLYILLSRIAYKMSAKRFEKVDL